MRLDSDSIERFHAALPDDPRVRRVRMFGMWLAKVGDHHFAGIHKTGVMARLPKPDRDALMAQGATPWEPAPGRPRPDVVNLPQNVVQNPKLLSQWVRRAFDHALALPAKTPKRSAKKKAPAPRNGRPQKSIEKSPPRAKTKGT